MGVTSGVWVALAIAQKIYGTPGEPNTPRSSILANSKYEGKYFRMKSINTIFPVLVLVSQLLIGGNSQNALAQEPQQEIRREHLEYCVGQLTAQVAQLEAIKGVMKNENLLPVEKLEQVGQILTPPQKEQLRECMQQPMPPQPMPPEG